LMPKRKSLSAAVSRGKNEPLGKKRICVTYIDFYKINYPSG